MMIYRDEETYHIFENQHGPNGKSEFEFKDSYWDEMESMLDDHDAKQRKRRGAFFWMTSTSLVVLAFFGLYQLNAVLYPSYEFTSVNSYIAENDDIQRSDFGGSDNLVGTDLAANVPFSSANELKGEEPVQKSIQTSITNKSIGNNTSKGVQKFVNPVILDESSTNLAATLMDHKLNKGIDSEEEINSMDAIDVSAIDLDQSNHIILENRKPRFPLRHSLYTNVEAGIANQYSPSTGVSYAITAGLGYELMFHKNLAFQTGVNLQYREGLNQFYRNETKIYGFHSTRYFQDVNYKGQINVEIPLALKIKLNRSSITAGVGTSFLVGVRSNVEQYIPESSSVEKVNNNFGIKDGIRTLDVNLNLNYAYAVTPNIEVSTGISAGLLDQTSNEFFSNDSKDHNLQFRVGLKYFFFNK